MLRTWSSRAIALALGVAGAAGSVYAQQQSSVGLRAPGAGEMTPGQFVWNPGAAPSGPMLLMVNLATQRLVAYRNGVPIAVSTASTGRPGHTTPTGVFSILQKNEKHRSNIYSGAPMPFMQRLTWTGIALHAGNLPGFPASHGCIRLPHEFARQLFGQTALGMTVLIVDQQPNHRPGPTAAQLRRAQKRAGPPAAAVWRPYLSRSGPVALVISGADRRMFVLRNGVEIGSAPVSMNGVVTQTQAFSLRSVAGGNYDWMRLPVPGDDSMPASGIKVASQQFEGPPAFGGELAAMVKPGTVLLVIPDSLASGGGSFESRDKPITVLDDAPPEGESLPLPVPMIAPIASPVPALAPYPSPVPTAAPSRRVD